MSMKTEDLVKLAGEITQGKWDDRDGTTTGRVVVSPNEPKVRRTVASVGGPKRDANASAIALVPDLLAEVIKLRGQLADLRHEINEASDPDFLFGAMDNVNDYDVSVSQFADAASRAIRSALAKLQAMKDAK